MFPVFFPSVLPNPELQVVHWASGHPHPSLSTQPLPHVQSRAPSRAVEGKMEALKPALQMGGGRKMLIPEPPGPARGPRGSGDLGGEGTKLGPDAGADAGMQGCHAEPQMEMGRTGVQGPPAQGCVRGQQEP